ncbi:S1/P1 nuclease [Emticicia oligotrophica DSM 17448]|uniref:S1/P1 nuclease n=1 Tax=Emticicia oligotrophica (strain DSM 17448 / CIP 109782 / MTCC 6937 / GPTSA100-15) TaxID=929562 RepID=A0ABN4AP68_EMTOG|nr:S1/P1 nuclease [Emticicia oligotrophica]AFK03599.1 S1/P1 nuclease [Emticicia oligotrophica DSM 17448]
MLKKTSILLLLLAISLQTFAWGPTGHRVVGQIANSYLSGKAKRNIRKILGTESVAISSNWADFIKSDTSYKYLDSWHYINIKAGLNNTEFTNYLNNDKGTDAYTKLNFLIGELKKKELSIEQKRMYLRLLIHIAGDIHQPMHVSRAEDLGGNRIKAFWFSDATNLHALWDDKIIEFQKLSYTEYATSINHASKEQRREWQKQPMTQWFFESYQIANKLYADIKQPEPRLTFRYNFDNIDTLNQQLLKGGIRLAGLLNEIFG